jgi:hypothetical protein
MQQLWHLPAVTAVEMLQKQQVTPWQLVEAAEARWKVSCQLHISINQNTTKGKLYAMHTAVAALPLLC